MQEILLVVDMQRDFVDGALGTAEAQAIVAAAADRVAAARDRGERVLFTRDTHSTDYLTTQEGRNLPVVPCVALTPGWQILPELLGRAEAAEIFDKPGFGSVALGEYLREADRADPIGKITLIGLCTDICVVSNALLLKAAMPEVRISVDASCCAGVTPQSHENALSAMAVCQMKIERNEA